MGAWEQALRATAAHTTMVLDDRSCVDFAANGGLSRRPVHVTATQQAQGGAHWLEMSHDGYRATLGATWHRRLYLGADGDELRGEEIVEGERTIPMALRFHLHPGIEAQISDERDEVLLHVDDMIWRFRNDGGALSVEDSVYAAGGKLERTSQIVVTAPIKGGMSKSDEPNEAVREVDDETSSDSAAGAQVDARLASPAPRPQSTSQTKTSGSPLKPSRIVIQWLLEHVPQ